MVCNTIAENSMYSSTSDMELVLDFTLCCKIIINEHDIHILLVNCSICVLESWLDFSMLE